jgi:hypothetical protein
MAQEQGRTHNRNHKTNRVKENSISGVEGRPSRAEKYRDQDKQRSAAFNQSPLLVPSGGH